VVKDHERLKEVEWSKTASEPKASRVVEVARIELASKEETYFRLRDVVCLDTIPLKNKQKTEKSGLNCPFSSTNWKSKIQVGNRI